MTSPDAAASIDGAAPDGAPGRPDGATIDAAPGAPDAGSADAAPGAPDASMADAMPGVGDAHLSNLVPSTGALVPAFSSTVFAYTLDVPFAADAVQLRPTAVMPNGAVITIDGTPTASGALGPVALFDLDETRDVTIAITAPNASAQTYVVHVHRQTATVGTPVFVKPAIIGAGDRFGSAVAISGDYMVVGAPFESSASTTDPTNDAAAQAGAAYVFHRTGTAWTQTAYLKSPSPYGTEKFGTVVAIDGDTIAIGTFAERGAASGVNGDPSVKSGKNIGAVFVFARSGTAWNLQAYLKADAPDPFDSFGAAIALDGNTLAVGAPGESAAIGAAATDNSLASSGAAYVFTRSGTTWTQAARLKASNAGMDDSFGAGIALHAGVLAVSAPDEDSNAIGIDGDQSDNSAANAGAVYVFEGAGASWTQKSYLKPGLLSSTELGQYVAFDGTFLIATPSGGDGASYARRAGGWQPPVARNWTHAQVALAADRAFVGFPGLTRVSMFGHRGDAFTDGFVTITDGSAVTADRFGAAVAQSGNTLVVGAPENDSGTTSPADDSALDAGGVYVFPY